MGAIRIIPSRDPEHIYEKVATLIISRVMEKPELVLCVFAGTPAFALYTVLVNRVLKEEIDFARAHFVILDELIREDGSTPFKSILDDRLFRPLSVPQENIIYFDPERDHEGELARISGFLSVTGIDIALLSVDSRGHIGFHSAGSDLESRSGILPIANRQRWNANCAFSLGLKDLFNAQLILLIAAERNLAEVVQQLTEGTFDESKPISILQRHENVILLADEQSLSKIEQRERIFGFYSGMFIMDIDSIPSGRRILVVSPHPDDAAISVGGTMAMLAVKNRLTTVIMSTGHRAFIYGTHRDERIEIREAEVLRESKILRAEPRFLRLPFYDRNYEISEEDLALFLELFEELHPDWIFVPHKNDQHPAHVASRKIALEGIARAVRSLGTTADVWNYEGPWAVFNRGDFNAIISVPPHHFKMKLQAIRAHESQVKRTPYDVAAESLAKLRSSLVPEATLTGFGAKPPKLEPFLELFYQEKVK